MKKGLIKNVFGYSREEIKEFLIAQYDVECRRCDKEKTENHIKSNESYSIDELFRFLDEINISDFSKVKSIESGFNDKRNRRITRGETLEQPLKSNQIDDMVQNDEDVSLDNFEPKVGFSYYYRILYLTSSVLEFLSDSSIYTDENSANKYADLNKRSGFSSLFARLRLYLINKRITDTSDLLSSFVRRISWDLCYVLIRMDRKEGEWKKNIVLAIKLAVTYRQQSRQECCIFSVVATGFRTEC